MCLLGCASPSFMRCVEEAVGDPTVARLRTRYVLAVATHGGPRGRGESPGTRVIDDIHFRGQEGPRHQRERAGTRHWRRPIDGPYSGDEDTRAQLADHGTGSRWLEHGLRSMLGLCWQSDLGLRRASPWPTGVALEDAPGPDGIDWLIERMIDWPEYLCLRSQIL